MNKSTFLWACYFVSLPQLALSQSADLEYVKFGDRLWSRCTYGQVLNNGQCTGQAQRVGYEKLRAVVTEVNARFEEGAGSWVVPSIHEITELLHCDSGAYRSKDIVAQGLPAISNWCDGKFSTPTTHLVQFPNTLPSIYWSSTPALKRTPSSWVMNFKDGYIMDHPNSHEFYVRLLWVGSAAPKIKKPVAVTPITVAAPAPAPAPAAVQVEAKPRPAVPLNFSVSADGASVRDTQRGLVWSRCSYGQKWNGQACSGVPMPLTVDGVQAVLLEVNGLEKAGTNDAWRLPTVREMMSLVQCSSGITRFSDDPEDGAGKIDNWCDGAFDRPTINRDLFPDTPARRYWTATSYQGKSSANWGVLFNTGRMSADLRGEKNLIRLVRSAAK
jgi:hypothetical protein